LRNRTRGTLGLVVMAMLMLLTSAACGGGGEAGQQTYLDNCAACHGVVGEGQPNWQVVDADGRYLAPPHDGTGHTWHHADGQLFRLVKFGGASLNIPDFKSGMPAFQDTLTDDEIKEVLIHIRTFWNDEERGFQKANSAGDPFP